MWKFEARLIQEREKSGFSVEAFGAIAGVKKTTQYNYEKGERKPDIEYLYNISKIGCDIKYIVTGEPSLQELTADEIKLLESFRCADLQLKAAAMAVLESGQSSSEMIHNSGGTISFGADTTIGNSMTGGTVQKIDMRKNSDPDKDWKNDNKFDVDNSICIGVASTENVETIVVQVDGFKSCDTKYCDGIVAKDMKHCAKCIRIKYGTYVNIVGFFMLIAVFLCFLYVSGVQINVP